VEQFYVLERCRTTFTKDTDDGTHYYTEQVAITTTIRLITT